MTYDGFGWLLWWAMFPYLLGFAGLGIGILFLGGNSLWLWAFGFIPVLCGWALSFVALSS